MPHLPKVILLFAAALTLPIPAQATDVQIRILNVGSALGRVRVQLCTAPQWLKDCPITAHGPARPGLSTVTVPGVPPGTYGVIAFHDINDDGEVNQNLIGLPTEGVGFSRDARITFGAPRFSDAALQVQGAAVTLDITLHFEP